MPDVAAAPPSVGRRGAALLVDYLVISGYLVVLVAVGVALQFSGAVNPLTARPLLGQLIGFVVLTLPVMVFLAMSESSPAAGSPGKRRLGLRVALADGAGQISLMRALVRNGAKLTPWELAHAAIWQYTASPPATIELVPNVLLGASWSLVALNVVCMLVHPGRRALHDLVAGTSVIPVPRPDRR
jgi:uncharacterized RDD family membrane protein YckC